jgi:hypothetical protein
LYCLLWGGDALEVAEPGVGPLECAEPCDEQAEEAVEEEEHEGIVDLLVQGCITITINIWKKSSRGGGTHTATPV